MNKINQIQIGDKYGKLTCVELGHRFGKYNKRASKFECDCGKTCIKINSEVISGKVKSCGCALRLEKGPEHDYIGLRFGMLKVIDLFGKIGEAYAWKCLCDCGNMTNVVGYSLSRGHTISCGCYGKSLIGNSTRKHGKSKTAEYSCWLSIISRCFNPENEEYYNYGGRGISVSEDWSLEDKNSAFLNFLKDMGECPEGYSIDRIDVNGDYCKENCRWADNTVQSFNQRKSVKNTSGRTGVRQIKGGKWTARINYRNEGFYLGIFESFEDAVKAREEAELKYYGFTRE